MYVEMYLELRLRVLSWYRIWRPGPEDGRRNFGDLWKRVYLQFGFVFIQDMVERALVEEIIGVCVVCVVVGVAGSDL